jgi:hypothetical protein
MAQSYSDIGIRQAGEESGGSVGNRASHEDETVNPATSAILSNIAALRDLQGKHLGTARKASLTLLAGGGDVPPVSA